MVTINGNMTCTATFAQTNAMLTVAKVGSGSVSSTPSGINCGSDCTYSFGMGGAISLHATAAAGFTFAGWSGSGCQGTADCRMTISSNTAVTATFVNNQADKVGIYRPSTGEWFLDRNGDGCSTDKCVRSLAIAGAVPVVGDWNRSGVTLLGLFLPATAQWRLDINGNGTLEDCGIDNCLGTFGQGTDIPIAGKWSSTGYDRIGVFRPSNERWYLDVNGNGSLNSCSKDRCASLSVYREGDLPVTGDWNGDGVTQVGLYRPSTGQWFLDRNGDRSWDGCRRDLCISSFGTAEDLPVTGDWNGTGRSKVGLFRPRTGEWLLDLNGNNQWDGCDIDLCLKDFGDVGDIPVAGKW
jgi:Divergent InlB B-repeat domain